MKTVSRELAEQLHKAGIEIETELMWVLEPDPKDYTKTKYSITGVYETKHAHFPAPTTDELLEWLPETIETKTLLEGQWDNRIYWLKLAKDSKSDGPKYEAYYEYYDSDIAYEFADTPADALAKLALWVKEQ